MMNSEKKQGNKTVFKKCTRYQNWPEIGQLIVVRKGGEKDCVGRFFEQKHIFSKRGLPVYVDKNGDVQSLEGLHWIAKKDFVLERDCTSKTIDIHSPTERTIAENALTHLGYYPDTGIDAEELYRVLKSGHKRTQAALNALTDKGHIKLKKGIYYIS